MEGLDPLHPSFTQGSAMFVSFSAYTSCLPCKLRFAQTQMRTERAERKRKVSSSPFEAGTLRQLLWMAEKQWSTFRPPVERRCQAAGAWRRYPTVVAGRGGMQGRRWAGLWWKMYSRSLAMVFRGTFSVRRPRKHMYIKQHVSVLYVCDLAKMEDLSASLLQSLASVVLMSTQSPVHSISRNGYRFHGGERKWGSNKETQPVMYYSYLKGKSGIFF